MDGKQFLISANLLLNKGSDEADYRSAISRAYYACFIETRKRTFECCDRTVLKKAGFVEELRIKHKTLQDYLKQSSDENIRNLGVDLISLFGFRSEADYNMSTSIVASEAQDAIREANDYLSALKKVKINQVKSAIEDYINKIYP